MSFRWKSSVVITIPVLVLAAISMSFLSARSGHRLLKSGKPAVVDDDPHLPDDGNGQDMPSNSKLDLRNEEYHHWEDRARAAMRDGSVKDPRRIFKLIQAFGSLLPRIQEVVRMPTPTVQVFRKYIAPAGLPVIFTDMFKDHPFRQWTWAVLKKKYGHIKFQDVRQGSLQNDTSPYGKKGVNRVSVQLADFIDLVTGTKKAKSSAEEGLYIAKKQLLPKDILQKEFPYPPFYNGVMENCFTEPSSWFGMAGTLTQGHIDARDNFAYQIIGQKRWHLYSPQDYKHLYFKKIKGGLEWSSALGEMPPNFIKYPLLKNAQELQVMLSAGEVLYLPRGWIHAVENVTPALMLNIWRKGPAEFLASWSEKYRNEIVEICDKAS